MKTDLLFEPYQLNNDLELKNRIIMAPMTRNMANDDWSPTKSMAAYYAKRADAGLIITEGTSIRLDARGCSHVPGIFTQAHVDGWMRVTDAVHERGGRIFLQLWHVGRASHPIFLNGELPIGASDTTMTGRVYRSEGLRYGKSRAATLDEITGLIESYAIAANTAIVAGFDGVEIHGANGYLIDQFLHYHTNQRSDAYGSTPENMARFPLEVVKACGNTIGYHRTGLRLSPGGYLNEIVGDERDADVFKYLLEQLNPLSIAYVHTGNFDDKVKFKELGDQTMTSFLRAYYSGTLIGCGGYHFDDAREHMERKKFDLLGVGARFIANPDLIERLKNGKELRPYERTMLNTLD